jgi:5'(3')-deoxyribonucleotidase
VERLLEVWEIGVWDMVPPLGRVLDRPFTETDFWSRINGSADFWSGLRPHPWCHEVIEMVSRMAPKEWFIVSAPSRCDSSFTGKIRWLKAQFGETFNRFVLTPHKHLFAGRGVCLIDDRDSNVEDFRLEGGDGIVFPRYHNAAHAHRDRPLAYVRDKLVLLEETYASAV